MSEKGTILNTATVSLTLPVDHASCAEENDSSFPRPTCGLGLSLSGDSQAKQNRKDYLKEDFPSKLIVI